MTGTATRPDAVDAATLTARFFHSAAMPVAQRRGLPPELFDDVDAALAGVDVATLRALRNDLDAAAKAAAEELLADPGVRQDLATTTLADGDVLVALGDSITDDALSWATILGHLFTLGGRDIRVHNAGITGHTTLETICRLDLVTAQRPAVVVQLLGTNDARRHGGARIRTTSITETARNLAAIREFLARDSDTRLVRLTPPPVVQTWITGWQPFHDEGITWDAADIAEIATTVRDLDPDALDVHALLTEAGAEAHLLPDGLHPNLAGQRLIARAVLQHLARPA